MTEARLGHGRSPQVARIRIRWRLAALAGAIGLTSALASAQTVTFAQMIERNGTNDFVFTNSTPFNATLNTVSPGVGSEIFFLYSNISGLPADLTGFQIAHLQMVSSTAASVTPASCLSGDAVIQAFPTATNTILITRDSPAAEGNGSRTVLLSVTYNGNFNGNCGGSSGTFSGSTPGNTVVFASDFIDFSGSTDRSEALSFTSIIATLAINGSFLRSFTAAGTGTFDSNPAPVFFAPTPTPTTTPSFTSTPSNTATATPTPTITATPTFTQTVTQTPTITLTPTITATPTITPTQTNTPTPTQTSVATPSFTATPVFTTTPAPSPTPGVPPGSSIPFLSPIGLALLGLVLAAISLILIRRRGV